MKTVLYAMVTSIIPKLESHQNLNRFNFMKCYMTTKNGATLIVDSMSIYCDHINSGDIL